MGGIDCRRNNNARAAAWVLNIQQAVNLVPEVIDSGKLKAQPRTIVLLQRELLRSIDWGLFVAIGLFTNFRCHIKEKATFSFDPSGVQVGISHTAMDLPGIWIGFGFMPEPSGFGRTGRVANGCP